MGLGAATAGRCVTHRWVTAPARGGGRSTEDLGGSRQTSLDDQGRRDRFNGLPGVDQRATPHSGADLAAAIGAVAGAHFGAKPVLQ